MHYITLYCIIFIFIYCIILIKLQFSILQLNVILYLNLGSFFRGRRQCQHGYYNVIYIVYTYNPVQCEAL